MKNPIKIRMIDFFFPPPPLNQAFLLILCFDQFSYIKLQSNDERKKKRVFANPDRCSSGIFMQVLMQTSCICLCLRA